MPDTTGPPLDRDLLNERGMRSLALVVLWPLLAPAPAAATTCYVGPYTTVASPPLGCELVVVAPANSDPGPLTVTTERDGETIDVTGEITVESVMLEVSYANYRCDGSVLAQYEQLEPYEVYRIALVDVAVGETLQRGYETGVVLDAGACDDGVASLSPSCTGLNSGWPCDPPDGEDDDSLVDETIDEAQAAGGCNAGGGLPGFLGLLVVALLCRKRTVVAHAR